MARFLNANVWVDGVLYRVGDVPPPDVAERIGDHAWVTVDEPTPAGVVPTGDAPQVGAGGDVAPPGPAVPVEPPRAGRGSSREAWAAHAGGLGVDVTEDMTRDDIIAAVDALTT